MQNESSTVDYLARLIAFDTTSRNSNLELIEFVQSLLERRGIQSELTFDSDKRKANLYATLGEGKQPGVVLSGHTDVVPVEGQQWSSDPFRAVIKDDGRLYGRGSCDMKGFIAICLAKIDDILDADLATPVHLAFSYDEEVGCIGIKGLIEALQKKPIKPRACIIGEPTDMTVVKAHKGMLFKRCCVTGKSAHSSLVTQGVNAVMVAANTLSYIDSIARRIQREGPFDDAFDPPFTTLHAGVIRGGTVNNIIPDECQFDFEIRNLPDHPALPIFNEIEHYVQQELLPGMRAVSPQAGIHWETLAEFPGLDTPIDAPVVAMVSDLLATSQQPGKVSYGTEGGQFQSAGIPTVVCGPGSIEQAHKPDEYIELSQLTKGEQFIAALIHALD